MANIPKSTIATIADDGILKGPLVKGDFGLAGLHKGSKPYEYGVMEKYIPSETAVNEYEKQRIVLGYDGKLGLSRGYSEPSSLLQGSYVQYLKQSGLIGESIFAIELRNNAVHGLLSIDDPALNALARKIDQQRPLPKRAVAPKTSYCYLRNSDIALWYCQVNDVRVRNSRSNKKVFEKNIYGQDVSLMTTLPFIVSPQIDILTAIHNHLVAYGNVCSIFRKKQNGYNFLKCRDNRGFDDLDVVFDLTTFGSLRLSKANLFYHSIDRESGSDFYVCTIAAAGLNLGIWRMGLPMLMDKRTVFDMEHKLVYFQELMGNDGDGDERTYVKTLLVGMALMLSVWSVAVVCGNKMYYTICLQQQFFCPSRP